MKTLGKILLGILVCLISALLVFRLTGLDPNGRRPGLWLTGTVVTTPVADWSFTDQYQTVELQTRDLFFLPHSVTTYCVAYNGQLYLTSVYEPGLVFPRGRRWNENVVRNPHVRIKIGDKLYDRTLVYVADPTLRAAVIQNKRKKYPQQVIPPGAYIHVFHVVSNEERASN
jgi:hypothetical protein